MRSEGRVENRAVYVAIGIDMEGRKDVLGLWTSANEGAKFWLQVLTELKNRGVQDIFIACVDGLKGFPQAIETAYPKTTVQLCIVHMVRGSLSYVGWKERKAVAADLKNIYRASTVEEAERQLEEFAQKWTAVIRRSAPCGEETGWGSFRFFSSRRRFARSSIRPTRLRA